MPLKTTLTPDEIQAIIDKAPTLRDKLIISFLADTGCRSSELLALKVGHIDFERQMVLIPHLKAGIRKKCPKCGKSAGRKQNFCPRCGADISQVLAEGDEVRTRLVNVGQRTLELCHQYLEQRGNNTDRLINLTRQMVYRIVREAGRKAGLDGQMILNPNTGKLHYVHPHLLRDSLAVDWLTLDDSGDSQKMLQDHLGHKRYETTARYFKLTPSQVARTANEVRRHRFGD